MVLFIKLAWRNIHRNKRRTILSGVAVGIGLASLIVYDALIIGMRENMVRAATSFFPGQGQIHKEGFRDTFEVSDYIVNSQEVLNRLKRDELIKGYAPRTMSFAMITSPSDVSSVVLYGINPIEEERVSKIHEVLEKGVFLKDSDTAKILIGRKLAQNLKIDIGDKVVITVAQAQTGELSQEMFRVAGIFGFNINQMDGATVFVNLRESQKLLNIGGNIHEIAFNFTDIDLANRDDLKFWKENSKYGNEALGWSHIFHDLDSLMKISKYALFLSSILLFGIVSIGIINTIFMSIYERIFEFGVLRALGTSPAKTAFLIIFEACFLALISILIGTSIGYGFSYWLSIKGIDYRGYEFNGVTIKDMIYPVITLEQYIIYPVLLFFFTVLIAIYPATYASKIKPSKAMRTNF